jgi:hypothetical protein
MLPFSYLLFNCTSKIGNLYGKTGKAVLLQNNTHLQINKFDANIADIHLT